MQINFVPLPGDGVRPASFAEAALCFEDPSIRMIARDSVGGYVVSTIFLVINHNPFNGDEPVLWETKVFPASWFDMDRDYLGDRCTELERRYHLRSEALRGHRAVVSEVRGLMI